MVRLVKGAYWDAEIKRAQTDGQDGFPGLHPQGPHRRQLPRGGPKAARRAGRGLPAVRHPQRPDARLGPDHGRAELLSRAVRVPVPARHGRAALRGGGRTRQARPPVPRLRAGRLARDAARLSRAPAARERRQHLVRQPHRRRERARRRARRRPGRASRARIQPIGAPHDRIRSPRDLYGAERPNSRGLDLSNEKPARGAGGRARGERARARRAFPPGAAADEPGEPVVNPADRSDVVGLRPLRRARTRSPPRSTPRREAAPGWAATPPNERAGDPAPRRRRARGRDGRPHRAHRARGGQDLANAVGEVREAVDFLRYYAAEAVRVARPRRARRSASSPASARGTFRSRSSPARSRRRSPPATRSIAKPAEETPLIAAEAVRILHAAGVPADALALVPGRGRGRRGDRRGPARPGRRLHRLDGGRAAHRDAARRPADRDAARPLPLIAETGGINAMVVDSSALPEQVAADVMASAFDSAGQRCSALRILCLQEDVADAHARDAEGRDGGARGRRSAAPLDRRRPDHHGRGARRDPGLCRGDARARLRGDAGPRRPRRGARELRRAGDHRGRARSPTSSARCSAPCCMCCATGARRSTR